MWAIQRGARERAQKAEVKHSGLGSEVAAAAITAAADKRSYDAHGTLSAIAGRHASRMRTQPCRPK